MDKLLFGVVRLASYLDGKDREFKRMYFSSSPASCRARGPY
jgi:hypothetical protein